MRWPWKRRGITRDEAIESRSHLAEVQHMEQAVDRALARRRATKDRNGFGPLFPEATSLTRRERP